MSERIDRVRVVNRNKFMITDRHDGTPYKFFPDQPLIIGAETAQHIFAFPGDEEVMHRHMARRWGWNRKEHCEIDAEGVMVWQKMCRNVEIAVEHYELRRVVRDDKDPIPAEEAEDLTADMDPDERREPAPKRPAVGQRRARLKTKTRRGPGRPRVVRPVPQAEPAPVALVLAEAPTNEG